MKQHIQLLILVVGITDIAKKIDLKSDQRAKNYKKVQQLDKKNQTTTKELSRKEYGHEIWAKNVGLWANDFSYFTFCCGCLVLVK